MQHFKYSLHDIENMHPWEREVYLMLLEQHLEKEAEEQEKMNKTSA
jgi:hypothetical protein